jgi:hypothetical protein
MNAIIVKELKDATNWIGGVLVGAGAILPMLTPATLSALGFSGPWPSRIAIGAGLLCIAYRKPAPPNVSPTTPELPK